ncbi:MAG: UDP-N-acetylmuramoyl-L-alanine--D-glutamate ligase [bacterium]
MLQINGKTVLIVGAGKSGISAAKLALAKGAGKVILSDIKPKNKMGAEIEDLEKKGIIIEANGHRDFSVVEADLIVQSPGVPLAGSWYETAKRNNKEIYGEIEFAYQFMDKTAKIIAITGTNGKTTAAMLTYEILKAQLGDKVALGGNIGTPLCDLLLEAHTYEYFVLELSSFQLETVKDFKPLVSSILNITEDHLDRYASMQEYAEAKAKIFINQGEQEHTILNCDDKYVGILSAMAKCDKIFFSVYNEIANGYIHKDQTFYKVTEGSAKKIFDTTDMLMQGKHNFADALTGIISAEIIGLDMGKVKETLEKFKLAAHRIEVIARVNGKKYIDDSKGTNIDAIMKAVDTVSEPMVLILGGREKNTDFMPLFNYLPARVKHIIVFGENREKLKNIFNKKFSVLEAKDMEAVVEIAAALSDVEAVLLSPGCASFDMFDDYTHRGNEFKKFVNRQAAK